MGKKKPKAKAKNEGVVYGMACKNYDKFGTSYEDKKCVKCDRYRECMQVYVKEKEKTKAKGKAPSKPAVPPAKKPTEALAEQIVDVMRKLKENGVVEVTSTLLRDKLGLDKESGRDQVRRVMKKLEKDGKIVVEKKKVGEKKKRYVYKLKGR